MQTAILHKLPVEQGFYACADALEQMGARVLGSGYFATAYGIDIMVSDPLPPVSYYQMHCDPWQQPVMAKRETRVIKLTKECDPGGYIAAVAALKTHELDRHAPRYYGVAANDKFWCGELEQLSRTPYVRSGHGGHGPETRYITGSDSPYRSQPCGEFIERSPFLQAVDDLCHQYIGPQGNFGDWAWDLHGENVMVRGTQPVITDPICSTKERDLGWLHSTIFN